VTPVVAANPPDVGRHHARPRAVHRARRRHRHAGQARAIQDESGRAFSGCTTRRSPRATRSWSGSAPGRSAPPWSRSRRRSIRRIIERREHIDRAQSRRRDRHFAAAPIAADPYNRQSPYRTAGDRVNGASPAAPGAVGRRRATRHSVDIVPVESALRADERSARYRHNGAVVWLTGLPGSGKSTLARALERRLFGNGGSPVLRWTETPCAPGSTVTSVSPRPTAARTSAALPRSHPSRPQRAHRHRGRGFALARGSRAARRIADTASAKSTSRPRRICESRDPKGTTPRRAHGSLHAFTASATTTSHRPPASSDRHRDALVRRRPRRSSACWRRQASVRRTRRPRRNI